MAQYPNELCIPFCDWLLNELEYNFSGPRLQVITTIETAANNGTSVTDQEWNDFNMITASLYNRYLQWVDLAIKYNQYTLDWEANLNTSPAIAYKNAVNEFLNSLIADNIIDEIDILWLLAGDTSANSLIPVINPTFTALTLVNSPTFTAYKGFAGNGSNMYINSNWASSTNGVKFTQNSASLFWYQNNANSGYPIGAYQGSNSCFNASGSANCNGSSNFGATETNIGGSLFFRRRVNSASIEAYQNGSQRGVSGQASQALQTQNMYLLCYNNNGTPASYSSGRLSLAGFGSANIDPQKFNNHVQTLALALGFNN